MGKLKQAQGEVASARSSKEQRRVRRKLVHQPGNELEAALLRMDSFEGQVLQSIDLVLDAVREAEQVEGLTEAEQSKLASHRAKYQDLRSKATRLADA